MKIVELFYMTMHYIPFPHIIGLNYSYKTSAYEIIAHAHGKFMFYQAVTLTEQELSA